MLDFDMSLTRDFFASCMSNYIGFATGRLVVHFNMALSDEECAALFPGKSAVEYAALADKIVGKLYVKLCGAKSACRILCHYLATADVGDDDFAVFCEKFLSDVVGVYSLTPQKLRALAVPPCFDRIRPIHAYDSAKFALYQLVDLKTAVSALLQGHNCIGAGLAELRDHLAGTRVLPHFTTMIAMLDHFPREFAELLAWLHPAAPPRCPAKYSAKDVFLACKDYAIIDDEEDDDDESGDESGDDESDDDDESDESSAGTKRASDDDGDDAPPRKRGNRVEAKSV